MRRRILIIGVVLMFTVAALLIVSAIRRADDRRELEAYIVQLRLDGERLSHEDLGLPPAGDTNTSIQPFLTAVNALGSPLRHPRHVDFIHYTQPGTAVVGWKTQAPFIQIPEQRATASTAWEEFIEDINTASNALTQLRAFLSDPPTYLPRNPTNPWLTTPRNPFVEKRDAAQWLAADTLVALRDSDLDRLAHDHHALTQLVQMHRNETSFVNAMIRVAIAGYSLDAAWAALRFEGWTEQSLRSLQRDWEAIDLLNIIEMGLMGERADILAIFEQPEKMSAIQAGMTGGTRAPKGQLARLKDGVLIQASTAYWRSHVEEDQLLYMRTVQDRLDLVRALRTNAPGTTICVQLHAMDDVFWSQDRGLLWEHRHLLTSIAIPSLSRATETALRHETQRRMTVIAIALKRYEMQHGMHPEQLGQLVPDFLPAVPIDPMSGQPFGYSCQTDGEFTLYSVGEDGVDDGGDPTTTDSGGAYQAWHGKDVVWPQPDRSADEYLFPLEPTDRP